MRRAVRILGVALVVVAAVATGLWLFRGPIAERLMARAFERGMAPDPFAGMPDGLSVGLCGSGSPIPDPTRAGPCTAVLAGRRLFVVDVGEGSVKQLALMNLPPAKVEALFITHFHSDHIADLGELMLQHWGAGAAQAPLPVYGPTGVAEVVDGFMQAYRLDEGYRIAHHGPKVLPPSGFGGAPHAFAVTPTSPDVLLIDEPDLKVVAFPVDHGPVKPAVGYRFVYKGRTVVISGDTAASARVETEAKGADVLVHEGLAPNLLAIQRRAAVANGRDNLAHILHDIVSYHTTPEQAAGIAQRAGVRVLLFTHVIPPLPISSLNGPFLGRAPQIFHGRIIVGRDGEFITLPAGTRQIRYSNRSRTLI
jgi:ribonuclease Z